MVIVLGQDGQNPLGCARMAGPGFARRGDQGDDEVALTCDLEFLAWHEVETSSGNRAWASSIVMACMLGLLRSLSDAKYHFYCTSDRFPSGWGPEGEKVNCCGATARNP